jgi:hypothetical protein
MRLIALIMSLLLLGGCSRAVRDTDAKPSAMPDDFSFAIVAPTGVRASADRAAMPPGWVVLDADGGLRSFDGEVTSQTRVPRRTATLSRNAIEQLHASLAHAQVLTYGAVGEPVGDASAAITKPGSVGVWWSANGRRRSFVLLPQLAADDAALREIARAYDKLRNASWAAEGAPP